MLGATARQDRCRAIRIAGAMIELDNVTRTYGRKTAVKDLSLSIPAGELFAFLGPNGAGKTTTIKMLTGLFAMPPADAAQEIERQIELFDLSTFIDHLAESYSHGMKQRLVFAAALVHRPRVLILDEPMVGLDPQNTRVVKNRLRELAKSGVTIFMSTHTLSLAEEIADRIGVIYRGTLRFLGTVGELRTKLARDSHSLEQLFLELTSEGEASPSQHTS